MTFSYTESGFVVILEPGEEVVRCLIQFARAHEIEAAVVAARGSMTEVELGTGGGREPEHRRIRVAEPLEACSIEGAVTLVDGEPLPHLHGSFSRPDDSLLGGHIYEAICSSPVEMAIRVATRTHTSTAPPMPRTRTAT